MVKIPYASPNDHFNTMPVEEVLQRMAEIEGLNAIEFYTDGKPDINKILSKRKAHLIKCVTIENGGKIIKFELINDYTGYVYIIQSDNGLFKIGFAKDVQSRFSQIDTASPCELSIFYCKFVSNAPKLEKSLHKKFDKFQRKGEWFQLPEKQLQLARKMIDGFK